MTHPDRIKYLLERYEQNQASEAETTELFAWAENPEGLESFKNDFASGIKTNEEIELERREWDPVVRSIILSLPNETQDLEPALQASSSFGWRRWIAVAAVLLVASLGGWFLVSRMNQPSTPPTAEQRFKNDVQPGNQRAFITLADGRKLFLDNQAQAGTVAREGSVAVQKTKKGEIVYQAQPGNAQDPLKYNTLTNPRGSQVISLTLADGSRVWLDAASSITYPTAFTGTQREVTVTGQVYLEIAQKAAQPFIVRQPGSSTTIEVLGTQFNIMAFENEAAVKVTVLQGSVGVSRQALANQYRTVLKPGEQAVVQQGQPNGAIELVKNADLEEVMAWKNGVFKFQNASLDQLMKQVARWYDLDVVYEYRPDQHFVSTIPRNISAAQLFKILEATGSVHFKIDGKKVTVIK